MQKTVLLVKPEGNHHLEFISDIVVTVNRNYKVFVITMNEDMISTIYPDCTEEIRLNILKDINGEKVFVFVIEGPSVISEIDRLVGDESYPDDCTEETLRSTLAYLDRENPQEEVVLSDGDVYCRNYVDCPRNEEQAQLWLKVLTTI